MSSVRPHTRPPVAAGRFYDADAKRCAAEARRLCRPFADAAPPEVIRGAVVPHAGWVCSGRIAGGTLAMLAKRSPARTIVMSGSVHTCVLHRPATDLADAWCTPLGTVRVDAELRDAVAALDDFGCLDAAHADEHSLEVQLPLMQVAFGEDLSIVPCLIPAHSSAPAWGRALGRLLANWPRPVAVIGSSDLTHYGLAYGFTPHGAGDEGVHWAHHTNDRELLDLVERMAADDIVDHSIDQRSACGGGAVAATVAACHEMGAVRGWTLCHSDSTRELAPLGGAGATGSVGYAGVVFG